MTRTVTGTSPTCKGGRGAASSGKLDNLPTLEGVHLLARSRHGWHTPAGASLHIRGGWRWAHVDIDRYAALPDALLEQAAAWRELHDEYAERCIAHGRQWSELCAISNGLRGWHVDTPASDVDEVLERLFAIEAMVDRERVTP